MILLGHKLPTVILWECPASIWWTLSFFSLRKSFIIDNWYVYILSCLVQFSSVHFSRSVVSDSLQPHGLQQARLPGACSKLCPSRWCHPTVSSSVVAFSSRLQSFPASGSLPMSQFFKSGGQSIGVSASTSVLPMNIQDWSPLRWTGWISLQSEGLSRSSPTPQFKSINSLALSFLKLQLSYPYTTARKTTALNRRPLLAK